MEQEKNTEQSLTTDTAFIEKIVQAVIAQLNNKARQERFVIEYVGSKDYQTLPGSESAQQHN